MPSRHSQTRVLVLAALVVGGLLSAAAVLEGWLNDRFVDDLGRSRLQIQHVVAVRRGARNTQLALLERTFSPRAQYAERTAEVRQMLEQTLQLLGHLESEAAVPSDEAPVLASFARRVRGWEALVRAGLAAPPDAAAVQRLREQLDDVDDAAAEFIERSNTSEANVEARTRTLERRRREVYVGTVVAVAVTLGLSAWWWSQKERLRAERDASEAARLRLRQMAASIAHEINNQLGALQNTIGLLRKRLPDDELLRFQEDSLGALEKLTQDFREFSAPSALRLERLDLVELARQVASPFSDEVAVVADGPVLLAADRSRLGGALLNLVKNAVEAGGPVEVSIDRQGDAVRVCCKDRGPGVESRHAAHIGQPFFTTKARGTGLGLAVVKQLAEAYQGGFALRNRDGGGAVAELWLRTR